MSFDLKYFSWKPQCQEQSTWGYIQTVSHQTYETNYEIEELLAADGYVYIKNIKGMYGLKQAHIIAYN